MIEDSLRLGLIGAGRWGRAYIKTLERMDGFSLVRLASRNPESRSLVHKNCQISDSWRDVAEADDLDGVIIAAPPKMHAEITRTAISASNPVIVEKPLTLDLVEAETLLSEAEQHGAIVLVDHIYLYHPAYRALKKFGSDLGPVQAIHGVAGDWGPFRGDVSILWDRGSHDVAMCIDIFGLEPEGMYAKLIKSQLTEYGIGEAMFARLTFPGSIFADLEFNNLLKKKKKEFIVQYEDETLIFDDVGNVALSRKLKTGKIVSLDVIDIFPMDQLLMDFAAAIKKNKPDIHGVRLGVKVVRTLGACEKFL